MTPLAWGLVGIAAFAAVVDWAALARDNALIERIAATRTGLPVAVAGAWLFVASDATLGWDRFAAPEPPTPRDAAIRRLAVIVPYHLGQALLLVALVG